MRYAKNRKAQTRARIVESASLSLRETGIQMSIVEIMRAAGLTHGGFYAHFESREALLGEVFETAMDQTLRWWRRLAAEGVPRPGIAKIVETYLHQDHRDNPARGCAVAAFVSDIRRQGPKSRRVFSLKLDEMTKEVAQQVAPPSSDLARQEAIAVITAMIGTLMLARAADCADLSDEILKAGLQAILGPGELPKSPGSPCGEK
jgi:TetR/AcrR family transcriptional regulator, transcriptional repressor for nem operon